MTARPPDNDEGRPGEGRPRNDLLAGEINREFTPFADTEFEREMRLRLYRLERRVQRLELRIEQWEADAWFRRQPARRRRWWFGGAR